MVMEYKEKLNRLGITLDKSGKQICPQCSHTRKNKSDPCLSVTYTDEAVLYKCHNNCGFEGIVYYRDKYESKKNYKRPEKPKTKDNMDSLYNYFVKRCISPDTVKKYDIMLSQKNEIIFPYYKYGELVNIKYRTNQGNGKKTFIQEKESEKTLFGMDLVKDTKTLIWVEGEVDVLSFAEQGIYTVSIPQGASEKKLECIENCFSFIEQFEEHIIAVDNDVAGDELKRNLLSRLGKQKCKIVNWQKYKDANEALVAGEKLQDFVDKAEYSAPTGIITFAESFDEIYKYNYLRDVDFYSTGWKKLDEIIHLRTGHVMVVTGYPSRGKTTFVDNLLMNLSKKYDFRHLIASLESSQAIHYNTLIEMYYEEPIYRIIEEEKLFTEGYYFVDEHFLKYDTENYWSIEEIIDNSELAVRKYGAKTLVLDPYNRFKNEFVYGREDLFVGKVLSKLIMFCKKFDVLGIIVAHPKKPDGEKMPNMYSISGSADWYNMTDYGIVVHRERDSQTGKLSNFPSIKIEKVKNHYLGQPGGGVIELPYNINKRILENSLEDRYKQWTG